MRLRPKSMSIEIRCSLVGGIGNQLSIYAYGKHIAERSNARLVLDLRGLPAFGQQKGSSIEELDIEYDGTIRAGIVASSIYKKSLFAFFRSSDSPFLRSLLGLPLTEMHTELSGKEKSSRYRTVGYFTDPRHHDRIYQGAGFSLVNRPSRIMLKLLNQVKDPQTLVIHQRLGDSLKLSGSRGVLGPNYFRKGIETMNNIADVNRVLVFSDDVDLAQKNFLKTQEWSGRASFVGNELTPAEVLVTLSRASNLIVSNSSLSWWAAYTSSSSNIVAPSEWTKEDPCIFLLSKDWTLVDPDWQ